MNIIAQPAVENRDPSTEEVEEEYENVEEEYENVEEEDYDAEPITVRNPPRQEHYYDGPVDSEQSKVA